MPINPSQTSADMTLGEQNPLATGMSSAELKAGWPARIKDHSIFSARTTSQSYIDMVKKRLTEVAAREITPQHAESLLRKTLADLGYSPEAGFPDAQGKVPPATPGDIRDLSSSRRIQLILDTNVKQARSMGQLAASEDPMLLMTQPAWELTRVGARKKPRGDWLRRWAAAGAKVGWRGALKRRMVALKTSPIWQALADGAGGFKDAIGTPYPPFAFGSGLAWAAVGRGKWKKMCADEGMPDWLDDVKAKAKQLQAAKPAAGGQAAAQAPSAPAPAATAPTMAPRPAQPPPQDFKANLKPRTAADDAIDRALETVRTEQANAVTAGGEVRSLMADARAAALDATALASYEKAVADAVAEIKSLFGRIANYGSAVGNTPVPRNPEEQMRFNEAMDRYARAAGKVAKMASALGTKAARHRDAAAKAFEKALTEAAERREQARRGKSPAQRLDALETRHQAAMSARRAAEDSKNRSMRDAKLLGIPTAEVAEAFDALQRAYRNAVNAQTTAYAEIRMRDRDGEAEVTRAEGLYDEFDRVIAEFNEALKRLNDKIAVGRREAVSKAVASVATSHPEVAENKEVQEARAELAKAEQDGSDEAVRAAYNRFVEAADKVWRPTTELERKTEAEVRRVLPNAKHTVRVLPFDKTNPNYKGDGDSLEEMPWNRNCQRCVVAYLARFRGYNVTAKPRPNPRSPDYLASNWTLAYQGGEKLRWQSREECEEIVKGWGDGAVGVVRLPWRGAHGSGHVFITRNIGGQVVFIDPQDGSKDCSRYFASAPTRGPYAWHRYVMRVDNLPFTDKLRDCIQ